MSKNTVVGLGVLLARLASAQDAPPSKLRRKGLPVSGGSGSVLLNVSKIGIGVIGCLFSEVETVFGPNAAHTLAQACGFCDSALGSADPFNEDRTRAWDKPGYQGRVCAYCGLAKMKLFPAKNVWGLGLSFRFPQVSKTCWRP